MKEDRSQGNTWSGRRMRKESKRVPKTIIHCLFEASEVITCKFALDRIQTMGQIWSKCCPGLGILLGGQIFILSQQDYSSLSLYSCIKFRWWETISIRFQLTMRRGKERNGKRGDRNSKLDIKSEWLHESWPSSLSSSVRIIECEGRKKRERRRIWYQSMRSLFPQFGIECRLVREEMECVPIWSAHLLRLTLCLTPG